MYTTHLVLYSHPAPPLLLCSSLERALFREQQTVHYIEAETYTESHKVIGFQQDELFLHCLHFCCVPPVFSLQAKKTIFFFYPSCTTIDLLLPPSFLFFFPHPACTEDVTFRGPRWRTEPSDLVLPINSPDQRATVTCEADGSPPPQYR